MESKREHFLWSSVFIPGSFNDDHLIVKLADGLKRTLFQVVAGFFSFSFFGRFMTVSFLRHLDGYRYGGGYVLDDIFKSMRKPIVFGPEGHRVNGFQVNISGHQNGAAMGLQPGIEERNIPNEISSS
jgi:hypothetical protein